MYKNANKTKNQVQKIGLWKRKKEILNKSNRDNRNNNKRIIRRLECLKRLSLKVVELVQVGLGLHFLKSADRSTECKNL